MADCIFCKIIEGRLAADRIYEDEKVYAFLDIHPLFPGHILLCPRQHYDTLMDVPPGVLGPLFERSQVMAKAVESALGAEGSFVAINNRISQTVPHLHVHIIPRRKGDGLKGFFWPRHDYKDDADRESVRAALEAEIRKLLS